MTQGYAETTFVCQKCGRTRRIKDFYRNRKKEIHPVCKDCLTKGLNNRDFDAVKAILKSMDFPWIEPVWIRITNVEYLRNPKQFGPKSVLGKYCRSMVQKQYQDATWKDSKGITEHYLETTSDDPDMFSKTLDAVPDNAEEPPPPPSRPRKDPYPLPDKYKTQLILDPAEENEKKLSNSLSESDFQYLIIKWGSGYKLAELVKLEDLYNRYAAENDMNTDRQETLKKICQISLKMDNALDHDDYASYSQLSKVYESLRKSSKFTDSQKKSDQEGIVNTVGELVKFVEEKGGIIPLSHDPVTYPQDQIDYVINDMQQYVQNLIKEEAGMGDVIEAYAHNQQTLLEIQEQEFGSPEPPKKKKRGRPRKNPATPDAPKKKRGRPKKNPTGEEPPKRKRGRPKKVVEDGS